MSSRSMNQAQPKISCWHHSLHNMNHHLNKTFQHFLLVLILGCSSVAALHVWAPYPVPQKTKDYFPVSLLNIHNFTSTENVDFRCFYTSQGYAPMKISSAGCLEFIKENDCYYYKPFYIHPSTEFTPLSSKTVLGIDMSLPAKVNITHSTELSTSLFRTLVKPTLVEEKYSYQYRKHTFLSVSSNVGFKDSKLLPSFTYTSDPQETSLLDGFFSDKTKAWKDASDANFIRSENCGSTAFSSNTVKKNCDQQYGISVVGKTMASRYMEILLNLQQFYRSRKNWDISYELDICPIKKISGGKEKEAVVKIESTFSKFSDMENSFSSVVKRKHVLEFETSYVRSNPHLLTNIKSKYSAYCRLCETKSHQKISYLEKTFTITPTFTNLEFPEPQTRAFRNINKCNFCDRNTKSKKEKTIDNVFVYHNDTPSITQTLPPDIFPVPSTKCSLQTTKIPFIYSYEVMIDDDVYYSQAWTGQKFPESTFSMSSSSKPYILLSEFDSYRVQGPLYLESSIKSFPEVHVKSTEIPSIMLTHFSSSIG